jgi:hypothetical protein
MAKSNDGKIVMVDQLVASMFQNCHYDEYLERFVTSSRQVTDYASKQPSPLHPTSFPTNCSLITEQSNVIQF